MEFFFILGDGSFRYFTTWSVFSTFSLIFFCYCFGKFLQLDITNHDSLLFISNPFNEPFDPVYALFPGEMQVTFEKFGPSGTVVRLDFFCQIPSIETQRICAISCFYLIFIMVILSIISNIILSPLKVHSFWRKYRHLGLDQCFNTILVFQNISVHYKHEIIKQLKHQKGPEIV